MEDEETIEDLIDDLQEMVNRRDEEHSEMYVLSPADRGAVQWAIEELRLQL